MAEREKGGRDRDRSRHLNLVISGSILLVLGAVGCGVDVDAVEMEVFLNPLFEAVPLLDGEGIGLCDHRDDVHKTVEVLHELHVNGTKAGGGRREGRYIITTQENTTTTVLQDKRECLLANQKIFSPKH